jgi:hypothetical protein
MLGYCIRNSGANSSVERHTNVAVPPSAWSVDIPAFHEALEHLLRSDDAVASQACATKVCYEERPVDLNGSVAQLQRMCDACPLSLSSVDEREEQL